MQHHLSVPDRAIKLCVMSCCATAAMIMDKRVGAISMNTARAIQDTRNIKACRKHCIPFELIPITLKGFRRRLLPHIHKMWSPFRHRLCDIDRAVAMKVWILFHFLTDLTLSSNTLNIPIRAIWSSLQFSPHYPVITLIRRRYWSS